VTFSAALLVRIADMLLDKMPLSDTETVSYIGIVAGSNDPTARLQAQCQERRTKEAAISARPLEVLVRATGRLCRVPAECSAQRTPFVQGPLGAKRRNKPRAFEELRARRGWSASCFHRDRTNVRIAMIASAAIAPTMPNEAIAGASAGDAAQGLSALAGQNASADAMGDSSSSFTALVALSVQGSTAPSSAAGAASLPPDDTAQTTGATAPLLRTPFGFMTLLPDTSFTGDPAAALANASSTTLPTNTAATASGPASVPPNLANVFQLTSADAQPSNAAAPAGAAAQTTVGQTTARKMPTTQTTRGQTPSAQTTMAQTMAASQDSLQDDATGDGATARSSGNAPLSINAASGKSTPQAKKAFGKDDKDQPSANDAAASQAPADSTQANAALPLVNMAALVPPPNTPSGASTPASPDADSIASIDDAGAATPNTPLAPQAATANESVKDAPQSASANGTPPGPASPTLLSSGAPQIPDTTMTGSGHATAPKPPAAKAQSAQTTALGMKAAANLAQSAGLQTAVLQPADAKIDSPAQSANASNAASANAAPTNALANGGHNGGPGSGSNNASNNSSGNSSTSNASHQQADVAAAPGMSFAKSAEIANPTPSAANAMPPDGSQNTNITAALSANAPGLTLGAATPQSGHAVTLAAQIQGQTAAPDLGAIATHIAGKWNDGTHQFDIRLDPAELGRIDVRLSVGADGQTHAALSAEHPDTLNLLQSDSGTLVRSLRDAGLDMNGANLSFSLRGDNQPNAERGKQNGEGRSRALRVGAVEGANASSAATITGLKWNAAASGAANVRLDIKV
jgi:flagellar hook-length control protein FliK